MKARVNWHIFTQTRLDSGSLTMLGAVIHKFSEPGEYLGTILRNNRDVGNFQLSVDNECPKMQTDIDLSMAEKIKRPVTRCESIGRFVVNPNGYVLFYVSQGSGGYSVIVGKMSEEKEPRQLFDSRELTEGDIFAVTMIRPGTYSVTNVHADTRGEIVVTYPKLGKVPYRPSNPITIDCTKKAFNRKEIKIAPAQGQVYHIKTRSRIKIELLRPDDGASKAKQKAARRRKKATPKKG